MPSWLSSGNLPSPADNELTSLWKINDLSAAWAASQGKTVSIQWLQSPLPSSNDNEVSALQKINAAFYALAMT